MLDVPKYSCPPVSAHFPARFLDALLEDAEIPFGHLGRNYDDTPVGFDNFDDRYEPPPVDLPGVGIAHYGPGYWPLCGEEDELALHTDDPHQVVGCGECLELVAEDLNDNNHYAGHCLHCREPISAVGGVAWRRAVWRSCPHCGRGGW